MMISLKKGTDRAAVFYYVKFISPDRLQDVTFIFAVVPFLNNFYDRFDFTGF